MPGNADPTFASRALLLLGGIVGLLIVAAFHFFAAIGPVKALSFFENLLVAGHGLPFAYYIFRARRGWGRRSTLVPDFLVHIAWLPALYFFASNGSFGLPLMLLGVFFVYMVISQNAQKIVALAAD